MVKGCQRKIYYLKNTGSKYFEEAYLVLKREESGKAQASQTELSREAERIIKEALPCQGGFDISRYTTPPVIGKAMSFALGAASSSALIGIVALLISFS